MVVDARSQSLNGGATGVSSIDPRNKVIAPSDTTNKQRTVFLMTVDVEIRRMRALKKMGVQPEVSSTRPKFFYANSDEAIL